MPTPDQDKIRKAWNYASLAHNNQYMPGNALPYINHIGSVAMEAMAAVIQNKDMVDPELLILCAILHDILEDTKGFYSEIEKQFGKKVADGVVALTKDKNLPSKEAQMKDSIERIRKQPHEVWMVKLCDRIANLQPPPEHWNNDKIDAYRDEAVFILESLGEANQDLSSRLKMKIDMYGKTMGRNI
ncbi:MAG: HD domain-containing protein [Desulfobacteraceae bacterium]|jgi:(p)ppGpp synthase/HD superfamily hydrolase